MGRGERYLVTGGTGFLGSHLVQLVGSAKFVCGSVLNKDDLEKASRNVTGIFHLAGLVLHSRTQYGEIEKMKTVNHDGAVAAFEQAKRCGCRLVYASTSGVVACSKDPNEYFDDWAPYCKEVVKGWPYYANKIETEELLRDRARKEGVDLICMRPSLILGPGDHRLSSTIIVLNFLKGKIPFISPGGVSAVDVRDAAIAFASAMERGIPGNTYLLSGYSADMRAFYRLLEKISGVRGPKFTVPGFVSVWGATVLNAINALFGKYDPGVDPVFAEMGTHFWNVDPCAAEKDLGITFRSIEESLKDTVDFIKIHGQSR